VNGLSWAKDSTHLVSCSLDGTSILWSIKADK
jgi:WD40 repeat protein